MPIIKSAAKKLRQDKKRESQNKGIKKIVKKVIWEYKRKPTPSLLSKVFSTLDLAAKKNIYHANKTARLKSRLTRLLKKRPHAAAVSAAVKTKSPRKKKTGV